MGEMQDRRWAADPGDVKKVILVTFHRSQVGGAFVMHHLYQYLILKSGPKRMLQQSDGNNV